MLSIQSLTESILSSISYLLSASIQYIRDKATAFLPVGFDRHHDAGNETHVELHFHYDPEDLIARFARNTPLHFENFQPIETDTLQLRFSVPVDVRSELTRAREEYRRQQRFPVLAMPVPSPVGHGHIEIKPEMIAAQKIIANSWRTYYRTLCDNIKLVDDSIFDFQGKRYSTTCPISLGVMTNPTVLTTRELNNEGVEQVYEHVFDKKCILNWFKLAQTNPLNKLQCTKNDLRDFPELKKFIREEGKLKACEMTRIKLLNG